jgi:serine protease AprX
MAVGRHSQDRQQRPRRWGFGLLPKTVQPTGKGVGVALIDTGVAPVPGLTTGNVVNGPDLSFDSQDPAKRYIDGYGHGTHMAGIISARTPDLTGLAPDAKLTSIKVGSSSGAVDVSQVIAAVDWAVAHRNDDPKNPIRVLVLAYGTDGVQTYQLDPLGTAVENAWRAGITVVAAGGNRGNKAKLLNPATNPFVLAVGAYDDSGTVTWNDDKLASFTSVGDTSRRIDLVAPGRSIVSLREITRRHELMDRALLGGAVLGRAVLGQRFMGRAVLGQRFLVLT